LYNNLSLSGRFYYPDLNIPQPVFLSSGMKDWDNAAIIPYANIVFVSFDSASQSVKLIDNLTELPNFPIDASGYSPFTHITTRSPQSIVYRWLVK
jgi:hypothetical protein